VRKVQDSRTSFLMSASPRLCNGSPACWRCCLGTSFSRVRPAGVGMGRKPPRFLAAGDELVTYIEGVGEMRHRIVSR